MFEMLAWLKQNTLATGIEERRRGKGKGVVIGIETKKPPAHSRLEVAVRSSLMQDGCGRWT